MEMREIGRFGALIGLVGEFVEHQNGVWDHEAWLDFLTELQKKGFELSNDMKAYLGLVLEAMKKLYYASTAPEDMQLYLFNISEQVMTFIIKTSGSWGHSDWERFLDELSEKGIELTDETRSYLGEVLESIKELYFVLLPLMINARQREVSRKE